MDYLGVPITAHSNCCDFCKVMRSSAKYRAYCEKCDSRGGLEAARIQSPFIYFCHAGLIDIAIPIIVDKLYLGAFMAGQILLDNNSHMNRLEHVLSGTTESMDFSNDSTLKSYYSKLPVMSLERIDALAKMLQHIVNYCVEQAILRWTINQLREKLSVVNSDGIIQRANEVEKANISQGEIASKILQPAIEYIENHPEEKITLSKMASLCKVSDSYFSKLFAKENIGSLSNYVNLTKFKRAKKLLLETDLPIRNIADDLGFDDCSYFIKVFKRETGMTPGDFRNNGGLHKQY